jgi:hypothetical protein
MLTPATNSTSQPKPAALLTRHEAAEYVRRELGRPLSFSTMTKLCALGEGPPVTEYWGRRPLYSPDGLRQWVESRGRSKPLGPLIPIPPAPAPKAATQPTPPPPRKRGRPAKVQSAAAAAGA